MDKKEKSKVNTELKEGCCSAQSKQTTINQNVDFSSVWGQTTVSSQEEFEVTDNIG